MFFSDVLDDLTNRVLDPKCFSARGTEMDSISDLSG